MEVWESFVCVFLTCNFFIFFDFAYSHLGFLILPFLSRMFNLTCGSVWLVDGFYRRPELKRTSFYFLAFAFLFFLNVDSSYNAGLVACLFVRWT